MRFFFFVDYFTCMFLKSPSQLMNITCTWHLDKIQILFRLHVQCKIQRTEFVAFDAVFSCYFYQGPTLDKHFEIKIKVTRILNNCLTLWNSNQWESTSFLSENLSEPESGTCCFVRYSLFINMCYLNDFVASHFVSLPFPS